MAGLGGRRVARRGRAEPAHERRRRVSVHVERRRRPGRSCADLVAGRTASLSIRARRWLRLAVEHRPREGKGLIAAGGEATRLGELTRVTNKHLLPVGAWPMVYYPLQLLQLAGIREVMIVTGQGHAGQLIDLLGDGRMRQRGTATPLFDLDLTYKVQVEAGRDRAGRRHGRELRRRRRRSSSASATTSSSTREADAIRSFVEGDDGAAVFVEGGARPRALRRRRLRRGRARRRRGREGRRRRHALPVAAVERRGRRAVLLLARRLRRDPRRSSRRRAASSRSPTSTAHYAEQGTLACHRVSGWWEDAGTQESLPEIGALIGRDRREQGRAVIDGLLRIPLRRFEDERGWFMELAARARCRSRRGRRTSPSRGRA